MSRSQSCHTGVDNHAPALSKDSPSPQVFALIQGVRQLRHVLCTLSDDQYARKPVGHFNSSVGGHVRHSLDHIRSLLAAVDGGLLDYDERERDTRIETSRGAALEELDAFERALQKIPARALGRMLSLRTMLTSDGLSVDAQTSVGRELAFVLSHTIHHNALVAAMLHELGVTPPADFGYAPSTVAYLNDKACAPSPSSH